MLQGTRKSWVTLIVVLATAALVAGCLGAIGSGRGGGKGGGGGGGQGGGQPTIEVFADMVIVDRDVNGVPITTLGLGPKDQWVEVPQPIMFGDKEGCPLLFEELTKVGPNSVYTVHGIDARYVPFVDGEIPEAYAECTTEADLGRLSVARSPESVLDHALVEMVGLLAQVDGPGEQIGLDPAGRLTATYELDGVMTEKTIDAPAENLAAFQRILEQAQLSHAEVNGGAAIDLPVHPAGLTGAMHLLHRAAPLMGAAADKSGRIGLDEMIYLTQILTIGEDMNQVAKDLYGAPNMGGYFNFNQFTYDRATTYPGHICYLKVTEVVDGDYLPIYVNAEVVKEPILELVFPPLEDPEAYVGGLTQEGTYTGFSGENAWAFARAADDARAIINWMHEHPVPIDLVDYCDLENP